MVPKKKFLINFLVVKNANVPKKKIFSNTIMRFSPKVTVIKRHTRWRIEGERMLYYHINFQNYISVT